MSSFELCLGIGHVHPCITTFITVLAVSAEQLFLCSFGDFTLDADHRKSKETEGLLMDWPLETLDVIAGHLNYEETLRTSCVSTRFSCTNHRNRARHLLGIMQRQAFTCVKRTTRRILLATFFKPWSYLATWLGRRDRFFWMHGLEHNVEQSLRIYYDRHCGNADRDDR